LSQHAGGNIFAHYPPAIRQEFSARQAAGGDLAELAEIVFWPFELARAGRSDLLHDWLVEGGLTCGTFGVDVVEDCDETSRIWETMALRATQISWVRLATTAGAIRNAKRDGAIAFYAHCQPTSPVPARLSAFDAAHAKGLRSFMLTYNRMNNIGVGCTERVDAGLSMFGVDVVGHCNELGMIVDVSHCGHATTLDACRLSRRPVTANHTAAASLHPHARCKTDDALQAIADTGGVVGVVAVPAFLTERRAPTIDVMLDHIDYIADLIGWRHVAIGTDWPLQAPDNVLAPIFASESGKIGFRPRDRLDVLARLRGFDDCRDLPNITRGLVKRGYNDEQIRGISGENALRVFEQICG
jgi:membrane dipeptidase